MLFVVRNFLPHRGLVVLYLDEDSGEIELVVPLVVEGDVRMMAHPEGAGGDTGPCDEASTSGQVGIPGVGAGDGEDVKD